jgi:ectoine hydroxylase-related dioxygenase (phytanoyl-CoA dioxygenase family)
MEISHPLFWSSAHCAAYNRDGVTKVSGLIPKPFAEYLRQEAQALLARPSVLAREHEPSEASGRFCVDVFMHRRSDAFARLIRDTRITSLARQVISQEDIYFFYDQLFYKSPSTSARTQWHQDLPFWPLKGTNIPSIWIALTRTTRRTSGVQYVKGSQAWGRVYQPRNPNDCGQVDSSVCPDFHVEPHCFDANIVSYELEPGDAVVHHPLIIHGAGPNLDIVQERLGVSLRYCGPDVQWDDRPNIMFFYEASSKISNGTRMRDQTVFPRV